MRASWLMLSCGLMHSGSWQTAGSPLGPRWKWTSASGRTSGACRAPTRRAVAFGMGILPVGILDDGLGGPATDGSMTAVRHHIVTSL